VAQRHTRAPGPRAGTIAVGDLAIDLDRRLVTRNGREVHLTPTEYRLLAALGAQLGRVLTHKQLLGEVWGPAYAGQTHYLRVYMAQLRNKLEADPAKPEWLITEPAVGYRLRG
jgi:two-component system KDP operon response regulator KdpE